MKNNRPWSSQDGPMKGKNDEKETGRMERREKKRGIRLSERIERKPKTSLEDM